MPVPTINTLVCHETQLFCCPGATRRQRPAGVIRNHWATCFNEQGLIPVIAQDANTRSMLMFAWMNKDALKNTLATKRMTYGSRSRQQLWVKGETSGHMQRLVAMSFGCDGNIILCQVEQQGAVCYTGRKSCSCLNADLEKHQIHVSKNVTCQSYTDSRIQKISQ